MWVDKMYNIRQIIVLFYILFLQLLKTVWGSATGEVYIENFSVTRAHNCDVWSACDYKFIFCIDSLQGSSGNANQCAYARATTADLGNAPIDFIRRASAVTNPLRFNVPVWPGALQIKIQVLDQDKSKDEKIDYFYYLSQSPPGSEYPLTIRSNTRKAQIQVRVKVSCDPNYYGNDCSVLCVAGPSYLCDPYTGARVCLQGWVAPDCTSRLTTTTTTTTTPVPVTSQLVTTTSIPLPATATNQVNPETTAIIETVTSGNVDYTTTSPADVTTGKLNVTMTSLQHEDTSPTPGMTSQTTNITTSVVEIGTAESRTDSGTDRGTERSTEPGADNPTMWQILMENLHDDCIVALSEDEEVNSMVELERMVWEVLGSVGLNGTGAKIETANMTGRHENLDHCPGVYKVTYCLNYHNVSLEEIEIVRDLIRNVTRRLYEKYRHVTLQCVKQSDTSNIPIGLIALIVLIAGLVVVTAVIVTLKRRVLYDKLVNKRDSGEGAASYHVEKAAAKNKNIKNTSFTNPVYNTQTSVTS